MPFDRLFINCMIIVVDRFLSDQYLPGDSLFIKDLIAELARRNPMHSFVMLANQKQTAGTNLPPNITIYRINSFVLTWAGKKWWYRYILPTTLHKLHADIFLCVNNLEGPATRIPACLFLPSLPAGAHLAGKSNKHIEDRLMRACRRSQAVITFSRYDMERLQVKYPAFSGKIKQLKLGTGNSIGPFTTNEREAAKTSHANGLEYFAFAGDLHENHLLTELLKAFSVFKKWQRSNMQLVVAGNTTGWTGSWLKNLESYKYRDDIHVIPDPSKETSYSVIAGAYAFVYPALHDHLPVNILYAMQAEVPVITSSIPVIEEIAGRAVMYAAENNETGFAAAMQAIYKDEQIRDSLIGKGRKQREKQGNDIVEDCWHMLSALSEPK